MCEEIYSKLWVVKFCLKVVYPKYNLYLFLVYLAIKCRILYRRQAKSKSESEPLRSGRMIKLCCVPEAFQTRLISWNCDKSFDLDTYSKFLVVSQKSYMCMVSENPFYYDHGAVWAELHLAPEVKEKCKKKNTTDNVQPLKYDLKLLKSKLHKKLWSDSVLEKYNNIRIVRIVGSDLVPDDVIIVSEDESYNIKCCFGLTEDDNEIILQLKPASSMDCVPQVATSAVVQMMVNPFDLSKDFITELLNNYFASPLLIHVGDSFSIKLTREITTKYYYKYFDLVESTPYVYFKCSTINQQKEEGENSKNSDSIPVQMPFFIVKGKTELNLGENIHSTMPSVKHLAESRSSLVDSCPFGLKSVFCKMQESIHPFLINRQDNPLHTSLATPIMPIFLLSGAMGSGRHLLVKTLAKYNGLSCLVADCNTIQSTTAKQTESKITSLIQRAKACTPVIVLMDNFEVFAVDAENNEDCRVLEYFRNATSDLFENYVKHPIIFIAISEVSDLKSNILRIFLDKFHLTKLTSSDRFKMLKWYTMAMQLKLPGSEDTLFKKDIKIFPTTEEHLDEKTKEILERIAVKTETFLYGDLDTLVHFALRNSYMDQHCKVLGNVIPEVEMEKVKEEDFTNALECMRSLQSQHMDAPKIPKVYWEDIGGLDSLKKELLKTIEFPIKYPHLFKNSSLKRSGILLYGPPGCGKTLVAKALSTELNVSFLSVKGPELLNMYIGQSEENVRKVFESARAASPCIVFLDELDALAPRRGATGDSGGASDRVVSQLLAEVDGVAAASDSESSFVFIMGATNRPDLLEQSLLRPGRLDKLIYVGPYCGDDEKTRVLTALCHRRQVSADVSLRAVASSLPARCTGADLLQVVSVARAAAVRRAVAALHAGCVRESELDSISVVLETCDLWAGVAAFKPSTTDDEFSYYENLKSQM